jgi:hypothetical protein
MAQDFLPRQTDWTVPTNFATLQKAKPIYQNADGRNGLRVIAFAQYRR